MKQAIVSYHQDEQNDWVAELSCGHFQHVRHNPPWTNRAWTQSEEGRASKVGALLNCVKCEDNAPPDK